MTISHVHALALTHPGQCVIPLVVGELLVRVGVRTASPDLELGSVLVDTVDNVQALAAVDADSVVAREDPLLVGSAGAGIKRDTSTIIVASDGQAFPYQETIRWQRYQKARRKRAHHRPLKAAKAALR